MRFLKLRRIHFVGAGGVGMSGLAEILLLSTPLEISGCDRERGENTERLEALGAKIALGHDPSHVADVDVVVISSAVDDSNPEVAAARERGIPVIRRAQMLGQVMRLKQGIAVAGTHGKTTTTSLAGMVLTEAGFDPTIVVGGRVRILGTNARLGRGDFLVAEADEYDRSFLELTPDVAVITNVEADHLDCYRDLDEIVDAFVQFANRVPFYGAVVACLDDPGVGAVLPRVEKRVVTYGESPQAHLRARNVALEAAGTRFEAWDSETGLLGEVLLPLPGRHNVANALAAIAVGRELLIPFPEIARALAGFTGVVRRFEKKGERAGVLVVDDYAHQPTEIRATLAAARSGYPGRRIVALFQPHLFSRTRDFAQEFGDSLRGADVPIVAPIYAARETPEEGVSARLIADAAPGIEFLDRSNSEIVNEMRRRLGPRDLFITMGAGDVHEIAEELVRGEAG